MLALWKIEFLIVEENRPYREEKLGQNQHEIVTCFTLQQILFLKLNVWMLLFKPFLNLIIPAKQSMIFRILKAICPSQRFYFPLHLTFLLFHSKLCKFYSQNFLISAFLGFSPVLLHESIKLIWFVQNLVYDLRSFQKVYLKSSMFKDSPQFDCDYSCLNSLCTAWEVNLYFLW